MSVCGFWHGHTWGAWEEWRAYEYVRKYEAATHNYHVTILRRSCSICNDFQTKSKETFVGYTKRD